MIRSFLAIAASIYALSWCSSCAGSGDDPKPGNSIPEIDSTTIYPMCIPDSTRLGQLFGCFTRSNNIFFGRVITGDLLYPNAIITVAVNPEVVTVTSTCQSFQLPGEGFHIQYQKSGGHPDSTYFSFCDRIPPDNSGIPLSFDLESGQIIIASDKDTVSSSDDHFKISAHLLDARFKIADGDTLIKSLIFNELPVSISE